MQTATLRLIEHPSVSSNQRRWLSLLCILMLGWLNPLSCLWHCDRSNQLSEANQPLDAGIFICLIAESQPPASGLHTHAPNSNPNPANQGLFKLLGYDGLMMMLIWRWRKYCAAPLIWQSQASQPPLAPPPK
ncbi:hypothetical protein [Herpetosiphon sp. NSE202]|uniref:hypothetical protein n=1 Tax=Herpetosiphon sp. NSE202 TaxID=3351349 RepID=UPI0036384672